jgi:hypothetical protein
MRKQNSSPDVFKQIEQRIQERRREIAQDEITHPRTMKALIITANSREELQQRLDVLKNENPLLDKISQHITSRTVNMSFFSARINAQSHEMVLLLTDKYLLSEHDQSFIRKLAQQQGNILNFSTTSTFESAVLKVANLF